LAIVTVPPFLYCPVLPPLLVEDDGLLDDAPLPIGLSPPPHPAASRPIATAVTAIRLMPLIGLAAAGPRHSGRGGTATPSLR
jgi:hypothetical protein